MANCNCIFISLANNCQTCCRQTSNVTAGSILNQCIASFFKACLDAFVDFLWNPVGLSQKFILPHVQTWHSLPPLLHYVNYIFIAYKVIRFIHFIRDDYQEYLDLGPGGTPSTWWRIKRLILTGAIPDVFLPPHVPPNLDPYRGKLWDLPQRVAPRPLVRGVAPQTQIDQKTGPETYNALVQMLRELAWRYKSTVRVGKSFLEGHTLALFAQPDLPSTREEYKEFGFEIAHPHLNDWSLHMILHPENIRTIIEKVGVNAIPWRERPGIGHCPPVPEMMCFIYAPRNEEEMEVVRGIMGAAVWWVSEVDVETAEVDTMTAKERRVEREAAERGEVSNDEVEKLKP
ncbi:hypothetical protein B0J14DRAFT_487802 [Halenospora varia]|nr:hypothetical protein B0J14DRAFT_487802 [Halenospora varia]